MYNLKLIRSLRLYIHFLRHIERKTNLQILALMEIGEYERLNH